MQRGLAGAVFLLMTEFSTLRIRLQLAELSLMELIYCCLRWQDGVEVVAVPFHPALVKILAWSIVTRCWSRRARILFITVFLLILVTAAMVL